jgi:hypothetical protein
MQVSVSNNKCTLGQLFFIVVHISYNDYRLTSPSSRRTHVLRIRNSIFVLWGPRDDRPPSLSVLSDPLKYRLRLPPPIISSAKYIPKRKVGVLN